MNRLKYKQMLSRVVEVFDVSSVDEEVNLFMQNVDITRTIDNFLLNEQHTSIYFSMVSSDYVDLIGVRGRFHSTALDGLHLFVYLGTETSKLPKRSLYFVKNKGNKESKSNHTASSGKYNDLGLSFGLLRTPLESLESLVDQVYRPSLDTSNGIWGKATNDQRNEFVYGLGVFSRDLHDSIRHMRSGFELSIPHGHLELVGASSDIGPATDHTVAHSLLPSFNDHIVHNQIAIVRSINILQEWCRNIEAYLDDHNRGKWEKADSGIESEIDYWKSRAQR
jgi:hypothetical protein